MAHRTPTGLLETFGLRPLSKALLQARSALLGSPHVPPNLWGPSSLRVFKPTISLPTWLGRRRPDGRVPIYNFFNRVRPPKDAGYSVRVTYASDFRGGRWTYDGHNGTDFAVPVGTTVVSAAPGKIVRVENDFHQGGLKVCIDHGRGLFTTSGHLARALVEVGDTVTRGQPVALSGASGMDLVMFFPWVAPHVHFNTWVDGEPSDPFALPTEQSLWRHHNTPIPWDGVAVPEDSEFEPSDWDPAGVSDAISACQDRKVRGRMAALPSVERRAAEVMFLRNYRPAMFDSFPPLYRTTGARRPVLDLPFQASDYVGVVFLDE